MISLYQQTKECCGCGTCAIVCPTQAIAMKKDSLGFIYPIIDERLCISCGACKKACAFQQNNEAYAPLKVYAMVRKDAEALKSSSSGGAFSVFAEQVLLEGGVVFGAALKQKDRTLYPCHCMATTIDELAFLRGSKYVQSDLGETFVQTKKQLKLGKKVLYSGTPCQIAGLKSYLKQEYDNLFTIDLICHGVPNAQMFQEYLKILEKKVGGTITDFGFRDKTQNRGGSSGAIARVVFRDTGGHTGFKFISCYESSYYDLFYQNAILRDSCYSCPYAGKQHPADVTVGDFWGFEEVHSEVFTTQGSINPSEGVSLVIVNSKKGEKKLDEVMEDFYWIDSCFEKAILNNPQLVRPTELGINREEFLKLFQRKGFRGVDAVYWRKKKRIGFNNWVKYHVHHDLPEPLRKLGKRLLRKQ